MRLTPLLSLLLLAPSCYSDEPVIEASGIEIPRIEAPAPVPDSLDDSASAPLLANDDSELPDPGRYLNADILELTLHYPQDGTFPFYWSGGDGSSDGCTRDVSHNGHAVCTPNPKGTHCCGMTFELYMLTAQSQEQNPLAELSIKEVRELKNRFFGNSKEIEDKDLRLVQLALTSTGLGEAISDMENARVGDFVQFWRVKEKGLSGHQAIFLGWVRNESGEITAMRYWSSQKSTNGIGEHEEQIGANTGDINPDKIYLVRALKNRTIPR